MRINHSGINEMKCNIPIHLSLVFLNSYIHIYMLTNYNTKWEMMGKS